MRIEDFFPIASCRGNVEGQAATTSLFTFHVIELLASQSANEVKASTTEFCEQSVGCLALTALALDLVASNQWIARNSVAEIVASIGLARLKT